MQRPKCSLRDLFWATCCLALASGWCASILRERSRVTHQLRILEAERETLVIQKNYLTRMALAYDKRNEAERQQKSAQSPAATLNPTTLEFLSNADSQQEQSTESKAESHSGSAEK